MKRTLIIITSCILLLTACNREKQQIKKNAYNYLYATGNYLIDEAVPYASQETRERTLPFIKDFLMPKTDTAYIQANQPAIITIDSVSILCKDTAKINYTKETPIKILQGTIYMVKENGIWLAYVPLAIPASSTTNDNVPATPSSTR